MAALAPASTSSLRQNASVTTAFKLIQSHNPSSKKYGWAALSQLIPTPGHGRAIQNGSLIDRISAEAKSQGTEDAFRALALVYKGNPQERDAAIAKGGPTFNDPNDFFWETGSVGQVLFILEKGAMTPNLEKGWLVPGDPVYGQMLSPTVQGDLITMKGVSAEFPFPGLKWGDHSSAMITAQRLLEPLHSNVSADVKILEQPRNLVLEKGFKNYEPDISIRELLRNSPLDHLPFKGDQGDRMVSVQPGGWYSGYGTVGDKVIIRDGEVESPKEAFPGKDQAQHIITVGLTDEWKVFKRTSGLAGGYYRPSVAGKVLTDIPGILATDIGVEYRQWALNHQGEMDYFCKFGYQPQHETNWLAIRTVGLTELNL